MSGPFVVLPTTGQPSWTIQTAKDGKFIATPIAGVGSTGEVGYGQGGYGIGGYDAPGMSRQSESTPNWTVVTIK